MTGRRHRNSERDGREVHRKARQKRQTNQYSTDSTDRAKIDRFWAISDNSLSPSSQTPIILSMKILTWNIIGCTSPLKIRILKQKIAVEQPGIIFLQETKCTWEDLKKIARKSWPRCQTVANDAIGSAGGVGILWNPQLVSFSGFWASRYSISGFFKIVGANQEGFLSNVYGPSQSMKKTEFLASMHVLKEEAGDLPWIVGGDFNIIRSLEEKKGGLR